MAEAKKNENIRIVRFKRALMVMTLLAMAILGYHLYEYLTYDKNAVMELNEHDISYISKQLYEAEPAYNTVLARLNFQGKTDVKSTEDVAPEPLIELRNDTPSSTVKEMKNLFQNYELTSNTTENVTTTQKKQQEYKFLKTIIKTPIMTLTMRYLYRKGLVQSNRKSQIQLLHQIWFTRYARKGEHVDCTGFEHVFLAEIKGSDITGLHNWIYFSELEENGLVDYKGYITRVYFHKSQHYFAAVRLEFLGVRKPYHTLLLGTSPELEMSIYTVCFLLAMGQNCPVKFDNITFNIMTESANWRGRNVIAAAYPALDVY